MAAAVTVPSSFAPYKVSTITAVGHLTTTETLNLEHLYESIHIIEVDGGNEGFLFIEYANANNEVVHKGFHKKMNVKHRRIRSGKRFDNQATVLLMHQIVRHGVTTIVTTNMKLFKNGNVQMTGLKSVEQGHAALQYIVDHIKCIHQALPVVEHPDNMAVGGFKICMINSDFKTGVYIKRNKLYNIIRDQYRTFCRFEPTCYAGVALQPMLNKAVENPCHICQCSRRCIGKGTGEGDGQCKRVTIAIFGSGSIIITGSQTFEQLNTAYDFICNILKKHYHDITIHVTDDESTNL